LDLLFGKERVVDLPDLATDRPVRGALGQTESGQLSWAEDRFASRPLYNPHEYRWGDGKARILDFTLEADGDSFPGVIQTGQRIEIRLAVQFLAEIQSPIFGVTVKTKEGMTVYGANSESLDAEVFRELGSASSVVQMRATLSCSLAPGDYFISVGVATCAGGEIVPHDRRFDAIHIQVAPQRRFFGISDLGLQMDVEEVRS
jgi:lipopolysaccharide transport system ATP-binding protein